MLKLLAMTCILTAAECACGGGGPATVAPLPATAAVVGTHSVAPPLPRLVTLGDSITAGWDGRVHLTDLGYPRIVANALGYQLTNLAVDGSWSAVVLASEVPLVPADATIVTVYTSIIDGNRYMLGYSDATLANYAATMNAIVAGIQARAPTARIILAAPPNLINRQSWATYYATRRAEIAAYLTGMKHALVATGLPVVDLMCEPAMYDSANFLADNEHPLASGQAVIAQRFLDVIAHGSTTSSCAWESPVAI